MSEPSQRSGRLRAGAVRALGALATSPLVSPLLGLAARLRSGRSFVILTYHRIGDPRDLFFRGIAPADFAAQMRHLAASWNVLPVTELLRRAEEGTLPPLAAGVTFDDNYASVHRHALPVLEQLGLSAMVFVPTGPVLERGALWYDRVLHAFKHASRLCPLPGIDGPLDGSEVGRYTAAHAALAYLRGLPEHERSRAVAEIESTLLPAPLDSEPAHRMGSLHDLRAGLSRGLEVGSHTITHPILSRLSRERIREELRGSRAQLENWLQRPVELFAYPNGSALDFDDRTIGELEAAGYRGAFCTTPGINRADWRQHRYRILRNDGTETSPRHLVLRLAALEIAA